jgi:hypothetical protein
MRFWGSTGITPPPLNRAHARTRHAMGMAVGMNAGGAAAGDGRWNCRGRGSPAAWHGRH